MIYKKTLTDKIAELKVLISKVPEKHIKSCPKCKGMGERILTPEEMKKEIGEKNFEIMFSGDREKYNLECDCSNPEDNAYQKNLETYKKLSAIQNKIQIPPHYLQMCLDNYNAPIGKKFWDYIQNLEFQHEDRRYDGWIMIGKPGVGKTHLGIGMIYAISILHQIECQYINCPKLLNAIRASYDRDDPRSEAQIVKQYGEVPVLFIDDIGKEKPSEWVREKLYIILDERFVNERKTIFTTEYNLDELGKRIGEATVSRIGGMAMDVEIKGEDKRYVRGEKNK